jgi:N-carbamoyl-L-amino-acid hydrolase
MDRRMFARKAMAALGALQLGRPVLAQAAASGSGSGLVPPGAGPRGGLPGSPGQDLRVDGERLIRALEALHAFGRTPEGGISRVAFSDADRQARAYVAGLLEEAGFEIRVDLASNLVATRAGSEGLNPLMMGSHLDSVPEGGNFDGQVGSMGAVEVVRTLADAGHTTRHPLQLVFFVNEEAGKTGSRALSGEVEPFELDLMTPSGLTIGEGIRANGGDPDRLSEARIEAGSDRGGIDIGVVEGIVGIRRWEITVEGFANHAGTTPMPDRRDALVAAARLVDTVNRVALEMEGTHVATVGRIQAEPGAPNVIPGRVTASLEIRDLAMEKIDRVFEAISAQADGIAGDLDVTIDFEPFYLSRAAPTDPRIRDMVAAAATDLGLDALRMPSGAGHDAQSIAQFAPIGMIPSKSRPERTCFWARCCSSIGSGTEGSFNRLHPGPGLVLFRLRSPSGDTPPHPSRARRSHGYQAPREPGRRRDSRWVFSGSRPRLRGSGRLHGRRRQR